MENLREINCKEIFRKAYENRYTWNNEFNGYKGKCIFFVNNNIHEGEFSLGKNFKPNIQNIEDENIVNSLLLWMEKNNADYTNTFVDLMNEENLNQSIYKSNEFKNWFEIYMKRKLSKNFSKSKSIKLMQENNPVVIPRNHIVENVLSSADEGDLIPLYKFLKILENPYDNNLKISNYYKTNIKSEEQYITFCGT